MLIFTEPASAELNVIVPPVMSVTLPVRLSPFFKVTVSASALTLPTDVASRKVAQKGLNFDRVKLSSFQMTGDDSAGQIQKQLEPAFEEQSPRCPIHLSDDVTMP